jgi:hypothetical protein
VYILKFVLYFVNIDRKLRSAVQRRSLLRTNYPKKRSESWSKIEIGFLKGYRHSPFKLVRKTNRVNIDPS